MDEIVQRYRSFGYDDQGIAFFVLDAMAADADDWDMSIASWVTVCAADLVEEFELDEADVEVALQDVLDMYA